MAFIPWDYNPNLPDPSAQDNLDSPSHADLHTEVNSVLDTLINMTASRAPLNNPDRYILKGTGWEEAQIPGGIKGYDNLGSNFAPTQSNVWQDTGVELTGIPGNGKFIKVESTAQCISGGGMVEIRNYCTTDSEVYGQAAGVVPGVATGTGIVTLYATDYLPASGFGSYTVKLQMRHITADPSNYMLSSPVAWLSTSNVGTITSFVDTDAWN